MKLFILKHTCLWLESTLSSWFSFAILASLEFFKERICSLVFLLNLLDSLTYLVSCSYVFCLGTNSSFSWASAMRIVGRPSSIGMGCIREVPSSFPKESRCNHIASEVVASASVAVLCLQAKHCHQTLLAPCLAESHHLLALVQPPRGFSLPFAISPSSPNYQASSSWDTAIAVRWSCFHLRKASLAASPYHLVEVRSRHRVAMASTSTIANTDCTSFLVASASDVDLLETTVSGYSQHHPLHASWPG